MPKKLLFVSLLLALTGLIFFSILFSEKEVCGQSNSASPCCPCLPGLEKNSNVNFERLPNVNSTKNTMTNSSNMVANFYDANANKVPTVPRTKTILLPQVNSRIAPLLKTIIKEIAEYHNNFNSMEYAEYFGIRIGPTNYYFREDKESIKSIGKSETDTNESEICGRYAIVSQFPTNDNKEETANGNANIWRNFNGRWKVLLNDIDFVVSQDIYPLIMTKPEIQCLGFQTK